MVAQAGSAPADPAVVVRWARSAADLLAAADDDLDDLMITSRRSYRLVRLLDAGEAGPLLLHVCLDRSRANLAVARRELSRARLGPAPVESAPPAPVPSAPVPSAPVPSAPVPSAPVPSAPVPSASVPSAPVPPAATPVAAKPSQAHPEGWVPLPRRVPAAIPPATAWTPPPRASRWPSRSRPGVLAATGHGGAVVPAQRAGAADPPVPHAPPAPTAPPSGSPAPARWADDVGTMRRLLAGLRALR